MPFNRWALLPLTASLLLGACGGSEEEKLSEDGDALRPKQGRRLLGGLHDDLIAVPGWYAGAASGAAYSSFSTEGSEIVGVTSAGVVRGTAVAGSWILGWTPASWLWLRVAEVRPPDASSTVWRYGIELWGAAGDSLGLLCSNAAAENDAAAMVGAWSGGRRDPNAALMSFSCRDGVQAKVLRWGYQPGTPAFDAAIFAARADYCGAGVPYTRDGTEIDLWDILGINLATPPAAPSPESWWGTSDMPREAAWGANGAVCLTRLRWAELRPTGFSCPWIDPEIAGIRDPRVRYCEDMDWNMLLGRGALMFTHSNTPIAP